MFKMVMFTKRDAQTTFIGLIGVDFKLKSFGPFYKKIGIREKMQTSMFYLIIAW